MINVIGRNTPVTVDGETKTVTEWAEGNKKRADTIARRLNQGWKPEKAVNWKTLSKSGAATVAARHSHWKGQKIWQI